MSAVVWLNGEGELRMEQTKIREAQARVRRVRAGAGLRSVYPIAGTYGSGSWTAAYGRDIDTLVAAVEQVDGEGQPSATALPVATPLPEWASKRIALTRERVDRDALAGLPPETDEELIVLLADRLDEREQLLADALNIISEYATTYPIAEARAEQVEHERDELRHAAAPLAQLVWSFATWNDHNFTHGDRERWRTQAEHHAQRVADLIPDSASSAKRDAP